MRIAWQADQKGLDRKVEPCLKRGWPTGFEPANVGATSRCVNHFTTATMVGVAEDWRLGQL